MISGFKQIPKSKIGYSGATGNFGVIVKDSVYWYTCREYFHSYADCLSLKNYFYCQDISCDKINSFIELLENHLGIKEKTIVSKTNKDNIVWLNVSPFWVSSTMRHAFFTICLRAFIGISVHPEKWMEALWSYGYVKSTKSAVELFLKGYTEYTGNVRAWVTQFAHKDPTLFLIKPNLRYKIEKNAYFLWKNAGMPENKHHEFWLQAEKETY